MQHADGGLLSQAHGHGGMFVEAQPPEPGEHTEIFPALPQAARDEMARLRDSTAACGYVFKYRLNHATQRAQASLAASGR